MPNIQKIGGQGEITLPEEMWKDQGKDLSVSISKISDETVLIRRIKQGPAAPSQSRESLLAYCIAASALCDKCTAVLHMITEDLMMQQENPQKNEEE